MNIRPEDENYKYWTQQEDELLTALVEQSTPLPIIAKTLGRSYASCAGHSSLLGLKNRYCHTLYSVDEHFWDEPNAINCFFLGCLLSDGCLLLKKKNDRFENIGTLAWEVHCDDICLLESFKEATKFTGPIHTNIRREGFIHSKIRIQCPKWNKQLVERYKLTPRKTYRISPPDDISDQLFFCLLKGMINGDGNIHLRYDEMTFTIKITSCSEFMIKYIYNFLKTRFTQRFRNKEFSIPRRLKGTNCWEVSINGIRAICLFDYLRQYNLPNLPRKWDNPRVLDYVNRMKIKHPHFFDFSHLPLPV